MNPFEMVVLIVAIVMIAGVLKSRHSHQRRAMSDEEPGQRIENQRLREEVSELKERIKVLERITVEKENSLSREIEDLRNQR